jgi:hypothetical protein
LTARWRSDQQHVGFLLDEPQGGEVLDQATVEVGLRGEVELLQSPAGGQF